MTDQLDEIRQWLAAIEIESRRALARVAEIHRQLDLLSETVVCRPRPTTDNPPQPSPRVC